MSQISNKPFQSQNKDKAIHINEIDETLLTILDKESLQDAQIPHIQQEYSFKNRKQQIAVEIQSIAMAKVAVTFLQHIEPFHIRERFYRYKALQQIVPNKLQAIIQFLNPKYILSNILYSTAQFTVKDEINFWLKNKYWDLQSQNPLHSIGINYLSGSLASAFVFQFEMLYNIICKRAQIIEPADKFQRILDRIKLNSKQMTKFSIFANNKIVFSTIYFGTFDSLNSSIRNKYSNYSLLYYSIISSTLAQLLSDPLQKASIAYIKNLQQQEIQIANKYTNLAKSMFVFYFKNPSKLFEYHNRFFHRLFFNSITLCYYEWIKGYYNYGKINSIY
ncbi:hypothetical protein TTHERM_00467630 (macronuclear) [Tetrahymena thermophila SB210]|uniref:Uncharacterized protein n=1 Tax=Tetrahymena thermophila (strain SB210) TaxID=312017 RepID=I7MIW9_TETTS|nr:hypothetical protein TTHERM_00467630 [Tetrahymena thermophila SB210]EAS04814.1 hypothetical protein TTHERM_00467630 [Tetrahymena thermophila SB210]|eukprot:XP_001025059.1 hypothetical protein TTHERM_00467630 [Tetrahymena thermophila SB210]